jgi:transcriptional regulator GlxA family with amidase domain
MTTSVGIYLYPEAEVLDFAGPYEVFTTASRVYRRERPGEPEPFRAFTVARSAGAVKARAGLVVLPDFAFDTHPPIDVLVVAGGVVREQLTSDEVCAWIARTAASAVITSSVCTGAFLLARAGVLDGLTATTHWEDVGEMQTMFPLVEVVEGRRWIDEGAVVTSAGISAGIDMSLHLVERLAGRELALRTARQMDFDWRQAA